MNQIEIHKVSWQTENGTALHADVARLDLLHPVVSGNKYFKLKYNLEYAIEQQKGIITMGGAFSNHLAATAFICKQNNIPSIGLIRGEIAEPMNPTMAFCFKHDMKLIPVERHSYSRESSIVKKLRGEYYQYLFVPEGGDNEFGEKGSSEIPLLIPGYSTYSHIACAVGTGTTIRGMAKNTSIQQQLIAIPVLKINKDEQPLFFQNHLKVSSNCTTQPYYNYAGKGYAKVTDSLLSFCNRFFEQTQIPLDIVYTAKLFMAAEDLLLKNIVKEADRLLLVHTGGLQGNQSLPKGSLCY
jgi:1-aminocyclopropane-1-carboxylate deaminase/D-cysteine desulfhydrase-like pyridoxal-dependent ACC family enzyme